ncbi:methyltransferase domain-containing protein [Pulveribacter suum]|uniref:class I SAM-dependent methyltransferase n=1 Tax=Pulveribacter suum TaxID=2116657 RepID=UPI001D03B03D|nr:class I SAM-dependent methyltransferase [Pulveribacter suum]
MPRLRLRWPLPAVLAWAAAWLVHAAARPLLGPLSALLLASAVGAAASLWGDAWWRRALIALGFPLSLLLSGTAALPAWAWLLPLGLLLLLYPVHAWRDAPVFPTPRGALAGLAQAAPLPAGARVLDAGCGLGDGLLALRQAYPGAQLEGIEWSWPLALACRLRCRFARVRRGDLWAADWSGCQLVYLFQRPESMARAAAKAQAEMASGAWLVSLDFPIAGVQPHAQLPGAAPRRQPVWLYRLPLRQRVAAQATPQETNCKKELRSHGRC